jgi:hypothetical protein
VADVPSGPSWTLPPTNRIKNKLRRLVLHVTSAVVIPEYSYAERNIAVKHPEGTGFEFRIILCRGLSWFSSVYPTLG